MKTLRYLVPALLAAVAMLPWSGGTAFHAPTHDLGLAPADVTVLGADVLDRTGTAVAAGDFNGDGIDDLLLGADEAGVDPGNGNGEAFAVLTSATDCGPIASATSRGTADC